MEAQHVHHTGLLDDHFEQLRPLVRDGAHEQAAVGAALNRQPFGRRVLVRDQILPGGNEVVEHILLLQLRARLVPGLAVLAAAAHVGRGKHESLFEQRQPQRIERRCRGDVEAAVAGQQRRVAAVACESFLIDEEHRHAGAVLAVVEDFPGLKVRRHETGNLGGAKH